MSNLKSLPQTGHTNTKQDLAKFLRTMADDVESGDLGEVRQCLILLERGGKVDTWIAGGPCDNARVVGLIEFAKHWFMEQML